MKDGSTTPVDLDSLLPLGPKEFQLLMMVLHEPMHGYGIVQESADEAGRTILDLGTLYRIIGRLMKQGLLEDVTEEQANAGRQRRYYRATDLGRQVVRAEAARLRALLASDRGEILWQEP